jgi:tryptophan-rich sensory protein
VTEDDTRWDWYARLAKPAWTPPGGTIGTIWSLLYPIIIVTFGYVIVRVAGGTMPPWVLAPVAINTVSNLAFTPIQFGLRNLRLASADILVVLVTIVWCIVAFWPYAWIASVALVPYLAWVSTATVLQLSIMRMNR